MATTYNVHFAGEVITGHDAAEVRARLGKLFGADDATLDKLFSGNSCLVKRDCDRATAEKYRAAMQRAGAVAVLDPPLDSAGEDDSASKIAALAAAPDDVRYRERKPIPVPTADEAQAPPATAEHTPTEATDSQDESLQLRPPESAVLEEHERTPWEHRDIDTSALSVGDQGERLSEQPAAPPPAPDTSHLDMSAVGETIPNLPSDETPLSPNTDNLDLSPEGTDFSDCAAPEPPPPQLDLSGIDVAEEGEDMLQERYRDNTAPAAPDTDHISLKD